MTAAGEVQRVARVAKHSDTLEYLARLGFVGFGVTHLLLAWIAVNIAFGRAPAEGDQVGAFQLLRESTWGTVLLAVVAIGLAATAVWQALEAAVGHHDADGLTRTAERLASGARCLGYLFFAFSAAKLVLSPTATGGAEGKQEAAGTLLGQPGGQWLVGAIGVVVIGVGLGLGWYGLTRHFDKHLHSGQMSGPTKRAVRTLGVVGYGAKAVAYTAAGILVVVAAVRYDPSASRGIDAALRTLARQPWGEWLLILVAAGIAAYGLFAFAQARYRKV